MSEIQKMNISIVDTESGNEITTLFDMVSNPFSVGDEISINVDNIRPIDIPNFTDPIKTNQWQDDANKFQEKYRLTIFKVEKINKYLDMRYGANSKITIELLGKLTDLKKKGS